MLQTLDRAKNPESGSRKPTLGIVITFSQPEHKHPTPGDAMLSGSFGNNLLRIDCISKGIIDNPI